MKAIVFSFLLIAADIYSQNQLVNESLASCSLPSNWSLNAETGSYGFSIMKSSLMPQSDATCSIVYQQTNKTDNSPRKFSIATQDYSIFRYQSYRLTYGLRLIRTLNSSTLKLYALSNGSRMLIQSFNADVVQNGVVLVTQSIDIPVNSNVSKLKFEFEYEANGNDNNSLILIDNLLLSGPDNDDCNRAVEIRLDEPCLSGNNIGANFSGPVVNCTGTYTQSLWYKLVSDYTGWVLLKTEAGFNDAINVFQGTCTNLNNLNCFNQDEFGFGGERNYIQLTAGTVYYFRVLRQTNFYGRDDLSNLCFSISKKTPNLPANDLCTASKLVTINTPCLQEVNKQATFDQPTPSLNERSRADVWYQFTPNSTKPLEILSKANFADVITLYKGDCNQLTEVKCEDLGSKLIFSNPIPGTKYFAQVSGYFSTIEGNLCLEVTERSTAKPVNDECNTALSLTLGQNCTTLSNLNSTYSTIKGSCIVYSTPDIWYQFVAPVEREIGLQIQSGFMFNYTLYVGTCSKLTEVVCGLQPDPCQGIIPIRNLTPGQTYFLQISTAAHPVKFNEASLCVKADALSKFQKPNPLSLYLTTECLHGVLGQVHYTANGGVSPYQYYGPSSQEWYLPGQKIEAFIEDANGCRDFETVIIDCNTPVRCKSSNLDILVKTECLKDSIGRQTGQVKLQITGSGGSGAYFIYGTQDGSILNHEDPYQIVLIDSDSCFVIEEGKVYCPPFNCSQSTLKITSDYECIDSLLKARLNLTVSGNLGGISLQGNQNGDLLSTGESFQAIVTDAAGCSATTSGEIICHFDSCVYSKPNLWVNYDCLKDPSGNNTGKALLSVKAGSKVGIMSISGNQDGDTLNHNDIFSVISTDSFGCSLETKGIIQCIPVSSNGLQDDSDMNIFPNPCENEFYLSWKDESFSKASFTLFNNEGKKLFSGQIIPEPGNNHLMKFSSGQLKSSVYYLKIYNDKLSNLLRFVKI